MSFVTLVLGSLVVILISSLYKVLLHIIWRPYAIKKSFKKQGIDGPEYKFWSGSIKDIRSMKKESREIVMDVHCHDIIPRILPQYNKWSSQFGETFSYFLGPEPRVCITDPELVKQILSNKFGFYRKPKPNPSLLALLGKGLVFTEGAEWARHRRVVSPAFTMDKLKMMTTKMAECALSMLDSWNDLLLQVEVQPNAIEVNGRFKELTSEIISHTAFGRSYAEGKDVFLAQNELQTMAIQTLLNIDIPGYDYLPTSRNLHKWKLENRMRSKLVKVIRDRLATNSSNYGNDLLGMMLEACMMNSSLNERGAAMDMDEIIDECKTFFFAGHDTTSHWLTWTMFLLSTNQDWQDRVRDEVIRECGDRIPDSDMISKLKLLNMVLLEALRLYCPAILLSRKPDKEMKLGSITIPKGVTLMIPIAMIHRKKELWGEDANEFNPLRFENGITRAAKHPNAMLAFSLGPRSCVGQNFSSLEAKIVIAMILQRFSFSISPEYKHMPIDNITLQPQFGLPIVLKRLQV